MDYKKKYEEAERLYRTANADQRYVLEYIFPELCESENEKIRKELIDIVAKSPITFAFEDKNKVLSWLEKQGGKKPAIEMVTPEESLGIDSETYNDIVNTCIFGENKPKFKVGDIIRLKDGDGLEWTVEEVLNHGYYTIVCADRDDFIQLDDKWELVEQKSWSNEDERILKGIIGFISHSQHYGVSNLEMLNWLKSIKERIGGKL